jgi:hypothetical protein
LSSAPHPFFGGIWYCFGHNHIIFVVVAAANLIVLVAIFISMSVVA